MFDRPVMYYHAQRHYVKPHLLSTYMRFSTMPLDKIRQVCAGRKEYQAISAVLFHVCYSMSKTLNIPLITRFEIDRLYVVLPIFQCKKQ